MGWAVSGALRALRTASVILALAAMLCVSGASASSAHAHLNSPADHCDICLTAHMASRQATFIHVTPSLELLSFLAPPEAVQRVESHGVLVLVTRGPPSSL